MGGWFRKEIKTVADLKGLKMRIGGFAGRVLAKLGVVPQQLAGGDIYPALEKGTIDAAEWVGPYDDEKLGFHKVAQYYYYPGWWEGGAMLHNFSQPREMERAAADLQGDRPYRVVRGATNGCRRSTTPSIPRRSSGWSAAGAQLRPFPPPVMEACLKASHELYAEVSATNADFKKIWESTLAFRNDQYLWWQVAEYTYDTFLIRTRGRAER